MVLLGVLLRAERGLVTPQITRHPQEADHRALDPAAPIAVSSLTSAPLDALRGYWADPSIDPAVLKRAFPPTSPGAPAPRHRRRKTPPIAPTQAEWRELQREDHAVAY